MHWIDVAGPPGSGKSTLTDPLFPHRWPDWDGQLPPAHWQEFLDEMTRLFYLIQPHWSFQAAVRMNNRSIRKMATVARMKQNGMPYVQTGLVQRGLGFGWRMNDMRLPNWRDELRRFFGLMPVSIGVAVATCSPDEIIARNKGREKVKETAHENRSYQVPLMMPAIELALEVLHDRGVPVLEVSTEQPVEQARKQLAEFAKREPFDATASGHRCESTIVSKPEWWV